MLYGGWEEHPAIINVKITVKYNEILQIFILPPFFADRSSLFDFLPVEIC
jgi:hypothetical protein